MSDCLFCRMVNGELKPDVIYEDEDILAFRDINPQAPIHILVIPKTHIATLNDLEAEHADLIGNLFLTAKKIAKEGGFSESGYRTLINCNRQAGQTVFHVHLHILAGRSMHWPPG